jgi:hypothetical protein
MGEPIARSKAEPIENHERAVIARLLQASVEVLTDERIDARDAHLVLRALCQAWDRCMLAVRRGAPWILERETAWLDRRIEEIIKTRAEMKS